MAHIVKCFEVEKIIACKNIEQKNNNCKWRKLIELYISYKITRTENKLMYMHYRRVPFDAPWPDILLLGFFLYNILFYISLTFTLYFIKIDMTIKNL